MATEIAYKVSVDAEGGAKSLKDLKKDFKDAQAELSGLERGTKEYVQALEKLGGIRDNIQDLNAEINAFNPEGKVKAFGNVISGLASGFQAAQGAMALFGTESEDVQKVLLKVQAASAFAEGIKGVMGMKDAFVVLGNVLRANPIMAIATVLASAAAAFYGIYRAITQTSDATDDLNKKLEQQKEVTEVLSRASKRQIELLTAQGASEEEIIAIKEKLIQQQILELETSLKLHESKIKDIQDNDSLWESTLRLSAAIQEKLGNEEMANKQLQLIQINKQERAKEDLEAIAKEKQDLLDLKNNIEILNQDKINLSKKHTEEYLKDAEARKNADLKASKDIQDKQKESAALMDEFNSERKSVLDEEKAVAQQESFDAMDAETAKFFEESDKRKEKSEAELEHRRQLYQSSVMMAQQSADATKAITDLFFDYQLKRNEGNAKKERELKKKQFQINKAFSVAQIVLNTIMGITQAISSSPPPASWVLAGINSAMGTAATIKALSTKFEDTASGGGGGVSIPSGGSGGGTTVSAPTVRTPQSGSTLLDENGNIKPQPQLATPEVRARVVETDVTSTQKRVSNIETNAKV